METPSISLPALQITKLIRTSEIFSSRTPLFCYKPAEEDQVIPTCANAFSVRSFLTSTDHANLFPDKYALSHNFIRVAEVDSIHRNSPTFFVSSPGCIIAVSHSEAQRMKRKLNIFQLIQGRPVYLVEDKQSSENDISLLLCQFPWSSAISVRAVL